MRTISSFSRVFTTFLMSSAMARMLPLEWMLPVRASSIAHTPSAYWMSSQATLQLSSLRLALSASIGTPTPATPSGSTTPEPGCCGGAGSPRTSFSSPMTASIGVASRQSSPLPARSLTQPFANRTRSTPFSFSRVSSTATAVPTLRTPALSESISKPARIWLFLTHVNAVGARFVSGSGSGCGLGCGSGSGWPAGPVSGSGSGSEPMSANMSKAGGGGIARARPCVPDTLNGRLERGIKYTGMVTVANSLADHRTLRANADAAPPQVLT